MLGLSQSCSQIGVGLKSNLDPNNVQHKSVQPKSKSDPYHSWPTATISKPEQIPPYKKTKYTNINQTNLCNTK